MNCAKHMKVMIFFSKMNLNYQNHNANRYNSFISSKMNEKAIANLTILYSLYLAELNYFYPTI